jgi:hypothetical protein
MALFTENIIRVPVRILLQASTQGLIEEQCALGSVQT